MGIYDREYYRRETPSFLGSITSRGTICKWLIGANVVFFVVQLVTQDAVGSPFTEALQLDVVKILHGEVWRLLTHAFLHSTGDPWHILFNMWALWIFGSDVEDLYGPREVLAFYLSSALIAAAVYGVAAVYWTGIAPAIGASGAVMAVAVLCTMHYPTRTIRLFWFIPVPMYILIVLFVGLDLYTLLARAHNGVAVAAHLGGAAFGFLYYKFNVRITSLWPQSWGWGRRRGAEGRLRVYREEGPAPRRPWAAPEREEGPIQAAPDVTGVQPAAPGSSLAVADERLEAQMDAILEKISRVGKQNLTADELEVLRRASEALKRRRR